MTGKPLSLELQGKHCSHRLRLASLVSGGAGSLISEWLAHLGVGEIVGVDF